MPISATTLIIILALIASVIDKGADLFKKDPKMSSWFVIITLVISAFVSVKVERDSDEDKNTLKDNIAILKNSNEHISSQSDAIKLQSTAILKSNMELREQNNMLSHKLDSMNTHHPERILLSKANKEKVINNLENFGKKNPNCPVIYFRKMHGEPTILTDIKNDIISLISQSKSKIQAQNQSQGIVAIHLPDKGVDNARINVFSSAKNILVAEGFLKSISPLIKARIVYEILPETEVIEIYFTGQPIFDKNGSVTLQ